MRLGEGEVKEQLEKRRSRYLAGYSIRDQKRQVMSRVNRIRDCRMKMQRREKRKKEDELFWTEDDEEPIRNVKGTDVKH